MIFSQVRQEQQQKKAKSRKGKSQITTEDTENPTKSLRFGLTYSGMGIFALTIEQYWGGGWGEREN